MRSQTYLRLSALAGFLLALVIYAVTRLLALDRFPIYFFTDEAIHPVLGVELVQRGWHDYLGNFLPSYFQNGQFWNLSLSVYLHAITATLFGKTIFIARATSAVVSIAGAAAIALIGKLIFKIQSWWLAPLFLAATPAWFLHSRTAFETALMVSFYAIFLLFYLLYRYRSPWFLFPALIFGAATFYAYANGQAVMVISGALLFFSDLRYHLQNWRVGAMAVALLALLAIPYARFRIEHPDQIAYHLRVLDSYWLQPLSLQEKVSQFTWNYGKGLSPQYWFLPDQEGLVRHQMKGYGHIALWTLPLFLIGLVVGLLNVDSSAHRAVFIAALAAPFGAALAAIGVTRALAFIVPANLFIILGWEALVASRWLASARRALSLAAFGALAFANYAMFTDAVTNGAVWYNNYGLYGMQWGARQIFAEAIPDYARANPTSVIYVTPVWANGTEIFPRFFSLDPRRVQLYNVDWFLGDKQPLDPNAVFIATADEYERAAASQKFKNVRIERTIPYPDGTDGFYFVRLAYSENADAIFAEERAAQSQLVTELATIGYEVIQVTHSPFDAGRVQDVFDGDPFTLARGARANPLIIELKFPTPRTVRSIGVMLGMMNFRWTILAYPNDNDPPVEYRAQYVNLKTEPNVQMDLSRGPERVSKIRIEIFNPDAGDQAKIHVRELILK